MRFSTLEHLWHDLSDGSSRFLLHSAGRVRVDVQREARAAVAEHGGDCFYVHAALQRGRGEAELTIPQLFENNCGIVLPLFAFVDYNYKIAADGYTANKQF